MPEEADASSSSSSSNSGGGGGGVVLNFSGCNVSNATVNAIADVLGGR